MKLSDFSPQHRMALDAMKDQLLIVLIERLGGKVTIPVSEIDDTGDRNMMMQVVDDGPDGNAFNFHVVKKGSRR